MDSPQELDTEEEYVVEAIVGKRTIRRKVGGRIKVIVEVQVKWEGYGEQDNTWEPRANMLIGSKEKLFEFERLEKAKQDEEQSTAEQPAATKKREPFNSDATGSSAMKRQKEQHGHRQQQPVINASYLGSETTESELDGGFEVVDRLQSVAVKADPEHKQLAYLQLTTKERKVHSLCLTDDVIETLLAFRDQCITV